MNYAKPWSLPLKSQTSMALVRQANQTGRESLGGNQGRRGGGYLGVRTSPSPAPWGNPGGKPPVPESGGWAGLQLEHLGVGAERAFA